MGKRSKRGKIRGQNISESMLLLNKPGVDLNKYYTQDERETIENEREAVRKMIFEMGSMSQVCDKTFYVISFNIVGCTDEEEYIPNEVGVAKYSIRNGIEEHYHCFIDPGVIPLGYVYIFKKHSEDTHNIPISKFEHANSNYNKIFQNIVDFVNVTPNTVVPVFCREENLEQNWGCLHWLAFKAHRSDVKSIYLYDLTSLLMELRAYVGHSFPSRNVAVDILNNHAFDYTPDTRCCYHEDKDIAFCALAFAKRACLIFSDTLCSFYGIDPTSICPQFGVNDTVVQKVPQSIPSSSKTYAPADLHHKCTVSRNNLMRTGKRDENKAKNSDTRCAQPWKRKSHKPQLDNASCKRNDASTLNFGRSGECTKLRQPNTIPFVLNGNFPSKSDFVNAHNDP